MYIDSVFAREISDHKQMVDVVWDKLLSPLECSEMLIQTLREGQEAEILKYILSRLEPRYVERMVMDAREFDESFDFSAHPDYEKTCCIQNGKPTPLFLRGLHTARKFFGNRTSDEIIGDVLNQPNNAE